ncbi:MAG: biotin--[acetyl-CoA-carboxylase] ligase, partial [Acidobacteria bacterium]|nr:biotin--[acetyl-CoA-carboxylase] ligase [Acidobacteriota bacterium]
MRLALADCPSGTVVGADEQTSGHGRFGRPWHSERDAGLYFSIVLRPAIAMADIPVVTLALGLAVAGAIAGECGVECDLRWPNDVLIGERKCAGILTELHGEAVVAGVGINVNHTSLPPELAGIGTSIRMATGKSQSREELLARILEAIDDYTELLRDAGKSAILDRFRK